MLKTLSPLLLLFFASAVQAHPGAHEGMAGSILVHMSTHPDHWLVSLALVATAFYLGSKAKNNRPLRDLVRSRAR